MIEIDPDGDLNMKLRGGTLRVSRKALTLSSPVFLAMIGQRSRFCEATSPTVGVDGLQIISFEDDDFETMATIARIIHHQNDRVPRTVSFPQLYDLAVLCDKYNLLRCWGPWINTWAGPHSPSVIDDGYKHWLFISIVFGYTLLFEQISKKLILDAVSSEDGALVTAQGLDFAKNASPLVIGKQCQRISWWTLTKIESISNVRESSMSAALNLFLFARDRLLDQRRGHVSKVGGQQAATCDAINLGILMQTFPELCDVQH